MGFVALDGDQDSISLVSRPSWFLEARVTNAARRPNPYKKGGKKRIAGLQKQFRNHLAIYRRVWKKKILDDFETVLYHFFPIVHRFNSAECVFHLRKRQE